MNIIDFMEENKIEYKINVPMSGCTTFKIGGIADLMIFPETTEKVALAVKYFNANNIEYIVYGNCSNILIPDEGIRQVIIKTDKLKKLEKKDNQILAGAGCLLSSVANFSCENSLTGAEFMHGIPGSVGGAVYMNAGAYDGDMSCVVAKTTYVDDMGEIKTKANAEHNFTHRKSVFSNGGIICEVIFSLHEGNKTDIKNKINDFAIKRREKQPLEYPSAGSVYKRPVGYFAGKLIEDCGLKGYTIGGAQISTKHAGFIININNAKAQDVVELINYTKKTVLEKYGVLLETEIIIV